MNQQTFTDTTIIVAADHVTSAEVEDESIILDLEEGIYYGLNPTGARIWKEIQQPSTIREITSVVISDYNVDKEQCIKDVKSLVHELKKNNLIEVED
jgi:hypothetical protein